MILSLLEIAVILALVYCAYLFGRARGQGRAYAETARDIASVSKVAFEQGFRAAIEARKVTGRQSTEISAAQVAAQRRAGREGRQ